MSSAYALSKELTTQQSRIVAGSMETVTGFYDRYVLLVRGLMIIWSADWRGFEVERVQNFVLSIPLNVISKEEEQADFLALGSYHILITAGVRHFHFPDKAESIKKQFLKQARAILEASINEVSDEQVFSERFKFVLTALFHHAQQSRR